MPRKVPSRRTRRRKLSRPLPRQQTSRSVSTPRLMARQQIVLQLHDLVVACEELFAVHGDGCDCEACCVVSNFVGALRLFRMILEIS